MQDEVEAGSASDSAAAVTKLMDEYEDDDSLVKELAMRALAAEGNPAVAGSYTPEITYDFEHAGLMDDLLEIGNRILRRLEGQLRSVVCGTGVSDEEDRKRILEQIGVSDAAVGAAIVAVLVSSFAINPAVATVAAALVVRRVVKPAAGAAQEAICERWKAT